MSYDAAHSVSSHLIPPPVKMDALAGKDLPVKPENGAERMHVKDEDLVSVKTENEYWTITTENHSLDESKFKLDLSLIPDVKIKQDLETDNPATGNTESKQKDVSVKHGDDVKPVNVKIEDVVSIKTENEDWTIKYENDESKFKLDLSLIPDVKIKQDLETENPVTGNIESKQKKVLVKLEDGFEQLKVKDEDLLTVKAENKNWNAIHENHPLDTSLLPVVQIKRVLEIENLVTGKIEDSQKKLKWLHEEENSKTSVNFFDGQGISKDEDIPHKSMLKDQEFNLTLFVCSGCAKCFKEKQGLDIHSCSHLRPTSFTSDHCTQSFKSQLEVSHHIFRTHFDKESESCLDKNLIPNNTLHGRNSCHKSLKNTYTRKPSKSSDCGTSLKTKRSVTDHVQLPSPVKPYTCDTCKKSFRTKNEIISHMRVHTTVRNYACDDCGRSFWDKCGFRAHPCLKPKKEFPCSVCNKYYISKQYLAVHERSHKGLRPLSCDDCGKTFNDRKCFAIHKRTHTGVKPFTCSVCQKSFSQMPHLKRHLLLHSGVKPFPCNICGKSFRDKSNLRVHTFWHSGERPFQCKQCGKDFTQSSHLKIHVNSAHSEERNYSCSVCGDLFKTREILKLHILRHSDIKPFHCDVCEKSFIQTTHFRNHKCRVGGRK